MKKHDIPKAVLERVDRELMAGERLLWVGQPDVTRLMLRRNSPRLDVRVRLILSLLIGLLVSVTVASGGTVSSAVLMQIIGLLVLATILLPMLSGYIFGKRTLYAITSRRAIIITEQGVQSFGMNELQHIERRSRRHGTGDIIFKTDYYKRAVPAGIGHRREQFAHGFFGIENPEQVEALLLETFQTPERDVRHLEDDDFEADDHAIVEEDAQQDYLT